ncbi:delta subunit of GMP phosphodiesterase, partial [Blyttiomyces helicus]
LFEVKRPTMEASWDEADLAGRTINYTFDRNFLNYKNIGTTLVFCVWPHEIRSLRMIERHYFKDKLLKSFDFTFGFCIPNSVNTWEAVYEFPALDPKLVKEMVANPGSTVSDSFYFVDGRLVMHNKATYTYS